MAKYNGIVGYIETTEIEPGIWDEVVTTQPFYKGEQVRSISKFQTSGGTNDNVTVSNELSIIGDPYAFTKFQYIRYIEYEEIPGVKWSVESAELKYPRIILSIGGVYNGVSSGTTE